MTMTRRGLMAMTGAVALTAGLPALARETAGGHAFGSYWRIAGLGEDAAPVLAPVIARVDALLSPYRADSELSAFNRAGDAVEADPLTLSVTEAALALAEATRGAFDPTVGPLVAERGFGPIMGDRAGNWQEIGIDEGRIVKGRAGLTLDLNGIAKGRALGLMADALTAAGARDFLLELGGEVTARGTAEGGRPWRIAVDGVPDMVIEPMGRTVATSSNTVQGEGRFGHIIHNSPVSISSPRQVTVIHDDPALADGYATALFAAADRARTLAERLGLDAVLVQEPGPVLTGNAGDHVIGWSG
ncbi:MAG: FAD:protein FMN transferase [Rubricella sp.]